MDNIESPLVSIVMPVYNSAKFLVGALDSILAQTYENWELIAVDDSSSDNSYLILHHYAQVDGRIKVFKNLENKGVSRTSNFAISQAKGQFIARMDSDDIMYPSRLEDQVRFLQKHPKVIIVGGQVKLVDGGGNFMGDKLFPLKHKEISEMLYTAMPIQQGAMMVNAALLPRKFSWYNGVRVAEEVKLFFKLLNCGEFANLPKFVLKYRQYPTSASLKDPKETFKVTFRARRSAEKRYKYTPSAKAKIVSFMQLVAVSVLPSPLIYPTFMLFRKISAKNLYAVNTVKRTFSAVVPLPVKQSLKLV